MSLLKRLRRTVTTDHNVKVDERFSSTGELFAELERWREAADVCAVFDPWAMHLLVITRAHFAARSEAADRAALRAAPGPGFAIVLMSGKRLAPRAVTIDELKDALMRLESAHGW